jgi:hypothetical protein
MVEVDIWEYIQHKKLSEARTSENLPLSIISIINVFGSRLTVGAPNLIVICGLIKVKKATTGGRRPMTSINEREPMVVVEDETCFDL